MRVDARRRLASRALDARLQLAPRALVEHARQRRRQRRHHRAGGHRVALTQRDARQLPGQRCRDHVAIGQPRLAVLVDRGLEAALRHRREFDLHRPWCECPRQRNRQSDGERGGGEPGLAFHLGGGGAAAGQPGSARHAAEAVFAALRLPCAARVRGPVAQLAALTAFAALGQARRVRSRGALRARATHPVLLGASHARRALPGCPVAEPVVACASVEHRPPPCSRRCRHDHRADTRQLPQRAAMRLPQHVRGNSRNSWSRAVARARPQSATTCGGVSGRQSHRFILASSALPPCRVDQCGGAPPARWLRPTPAPRCRPRRRSGAGSPPESRTGRTSAAC